MSKAIIVILVTFKQFKALAALISRVIAGMTGNASFLTPNPTLTAMATALSDLNTAIAAWGTRSHHGTTDDYKDLLQKAKVAHQMLTQLGDYCMTVIDPNDTVEVQVAILSSSGFSVKNAKTPQSGLSMVQNFRRVIARNISADEVRLRWKKPLGTKRGNIFSYLVYRSATNSFATATFLKSVGPGLYVDTPGAGTWYYFVIATNSAGDGVISDAVTAKIAA